jgi:hypothetical protein
MTTILSKILAEKAAKMPGGLYHKTQIALCYNSNRIEGSRISEEQTRYIFETKTVGFKDEEALLVDDIIETTNHFAAFDYMLDTIEKDLSNEIIKEFHIILKSATTWGHSAGYWWNSVNGHSAISFSPKVEDEMNKLNDWYLNLERVSLDNIVDYYCTIKNIFGGGQVGRLVMFRECLKNNIVPFIIDCEYYKGLEKSAQDVYAEWVKYFIPNWTN